MDFIISTAKSGDLPASDLSTTMLILASKSLCNIYSEELKYTTKRWVPDSVFMIPLSLTISFVKYINNIKHTVVK